eukprot:gnl/TRDRNA2_/TRDRNA2_172689_c1_seq4.p1 gnl/TRDRNA2_/TRDRNA2_172689_c1~~gnl/TRDRNA2_/TRDRNA2_172689_c1_seq4.p1  ORF type:complete len:282 (+),score=44.45 gnl/TRDRNA2_/TRDRNA2_172689_c1_seq4:46-846(+)
MSQKEKLDITIYDAELTRIFDSLKTTQDVFVQLCAVSAEGEEKVVGKTEICKNGDLYPRWNERFLCERGSARLLRIKLYIDHMIRNQTLCGETEFPTDQLWSKAAEGPSKVSLELFKRGEQTGTLRIGLSIMGGMGNSAGASQKEEAAENLRVPEQPQRPPPRAPQQQQPPQHKPSAAQHDVAPQGPASAARQSNLVAVPPKMTNVVPRPPLIERGHSRGHSRKHGAVPGSGDSHMLYACGMPHGPAYGVHRLALGSALPATGGTS